MRRLLKLTGRYSQQQKNILTVPKKHDISTAQFSELTAYISTAQCCKTLAVLFRENLETFTDRHLTHLFKHIGQFDLQIDDHFHTVIVPITLEYVSTFTRAQAPTLAGILMALAYRNIESQVLWKAVLHKLDEQQIHRYLNLQETAAIFLALAQHKKLVNHPLMHKIQSTIIQQKLYYSHHPALLDAIKTGTALISAVGQPGQGQISDGLKQLA